MVAAEILSGCNIQYRLLYYPSSSAPSEESLKADNIKPWQSSITDYRGFIATNEVGHTNGTIIVFHGNGGTAADRAFYVKALGPLGIALYLPNTRGTGAERENWGKRHLSMMRAKQYVLRL